MTKRCLADGGTWVRLPGFLSAQAQQFCTFCAILASAPASPHFTCTSIESAFWSAWYIRNQGTKDGLQCPHLAGSSQSDLFPIPHSSWRKMQP